jgi:hypothetical protein
VFDHAAVSDDDSLSAADEDEGAREVAEQAPADAPVRAVDAEAEGPQEHPVETEAEAAPEHSAAPEGAVNPEDDLSDNEATAILPPVRPAEPDEPHQ